MNRNSFIWVVFGIAAILALVDCERDKTKQLSYHHNNETEEFNKLSRIDQVKKCGSCHQKEYENEMRGPHANAYNTLVNFKSFVNSPKYSCSFYTSHVNESFATCLSCHVTGNLFQTVYNLTATSRQSYIDSLMGLTYILPTPRKIISSYATGVDCLTCHYDGERVVTNLDFKATNRENCPSFCSPTPSSFFSSDANCVACHLDAVKTLVTKKELNQKSCIGCHQLYDENGRGTHYFFWRNDSLDMESKRPIDFWINELQADYSAYKNMISIVLSGKLLPHQLSECPEYIFFFEVKNLHDVTLAFDTLRLNKKKVHDKNMFNTLGKKQLPGTVGTEFSGNGQTLTKNIVLSKSLGKPHLLVVKILSKAQYWFPDSLGKTIKQQKILL